MKQSSAKSRREILNFLFLNKTSRCSRLGSWRQTLVVPRGAPTSFWVFRTRAENKVSHRAVKVRALYNSCIRSHNISGRSCIYWGVTCSSQREMIVQRNHPTFIFVWVEAHPTGHDYLICDEDYHGITVLELTTGWRVDYATDRLPEHVIFCAVSFYGEPEGDVLVVDGFVTVSPHELVAVDLASPMELSYPELYRSLLHEVENKGFVDGAIKCTFWKEVRAKDGKPLDELNDDEVDKLVEIGGGNGVKVVLYHCSWKPGSEVQREIIEHEWTFCGLHFVNSKSRVRFWSKAIWYRIQYLVV